VKCCGSSPWLNAALVTVMVDTASGVSPVVVATPQPLSSISTPTTIAPARVR
jgi:hypothetical protein